MRSILTTVVLVSALTAALGSVACTANIHDNTLNVTDPKVSFNTTIDTANVSPGESVPLTLSAQNVYLVEPTATPPVAHETDSGHFQIYLDDETTPPLLITASVSVSVTVPAATTAGGHRLICRIHKHDGTPTGAVSQFNITVKVTVGTDAG